MTSEQAKTALANRIAASPEFKRSLHRPEITEAEDEESDEADVEVDVSASHVIRSCDCGNSHSSI